MKSPILIYGAGEKALLTLLFHIETLVPPRGFLLSGQCSIPRLGIAEISDFPFNLEKSNVRGEIERESTWCPDSRHVLRPITLITDAFGSSEPDIALLKTIHTHMTLGKFSCTPVYKDREIEDRKITELIQVCVVVICRIRTTAQDKTL